VENPRGAGTGGALRRHERNRLAAGKTLRCTRGAPSSVRFAGPREVWPGKARERLSWATDSMAARGRASEGTNARRASGWGGFGRFSLPSRRDQAFEVEAALASLNGKEGADLETGPDLRAEQSPEGGSSRAFSE